MHSAIFVSLLLLAATEPTAPAPAATQTPPAATTPATPAAAPSPGSRRVCREETRANSRLTRKVCKTVEEWDERTETAREAFGEVVNRPVIMVCPPSGC